MELREITIGQLIDRNARLYPAKEAVVFSKSNTRKTWKQVKEVVDTLAKGLISLGVRRGSHVAIWGTNVPEWYYTQLAVSKIGGILITINPEWKASELEYALQQSNTAFLVMIPGFTKKGKTKTHVYDYLAILNDICPGINVNHGCIDKLPDLRHTILISEEEHKGMLSWNHVIDRSKFITDETLKENAALVDPHDVLMIQYTSGTTGFPKGAMLTHYNVINNATAAMEHMNISSADKICGPVPFYHCFGSILVNIGSLVSSATMVIPSPLFSAKATLEAVQNEHCSVLYGVPTMFIAELEDINFEQYNTKTLRTGIMAGAPVDKELFEAVTERLGAKEMTIAYGLTETSPVTHQTQIIDPIEKRITTVGLPIEHTEAKIVDPSTLKDLAPGEIGEIWVKGFHVMKGYYNKPNETDETIIDGWLRSGDLGVMDDQGYFKIVGRLKEMFIVGGHNVYPAEVEQAIHTILSDKVEIVQLVGLPHKKLQEVAGLAVKCLPGESLTLEELKARCEGKLEWPKIPRHLMVMDDFAPVMTVTGKIQKFKLKELMLKEINELEPA